MLKKTAFIFAPALFLAACGSSDTVQRDEAGDIILSGTWKCERVGGLATNAGKVLTHYTFEDGFVTAEMHAERTVRDMAVEGQTRIKFSYMRLSDTLNLVPITADLLSLKLNGEEATGPDLAAAKRTMERGLMARAQFTLGETEDGALTINDRGQHLHECSRG